MGKSRQLNSYQINGLNIGKCMIGTENTQNNEDNVTANYDKSLKECEISKKKIKRNWEYTLSLYVLFTSCSYSHINPFI